MATGKGNVLFITLDQWRGDSLSALGHALVETPTLDALAARGVLFANHWANTAPCGPSRATLYTGMYLQNHRSALNGTPLDARFTNVALEARKIGYDPVLFGYTDTSVDPRTVPADDPRLRTYEGVLAGFNAMVSDPYDQGPSEWAKWLAARGKDVPPDPHRLYDPDLSYPGAADHPPAWAPGHFGADETETAFITEKLIEYFEQHADEPFFVHASFVRPHPPYRNPPGYHDLYSLEDVPPFIAHPTREAERAMHPLNDALLMIPPLKAPDDFDERRQMRATYHGMQREVDDQLGRLFGWLGENRLLDDTLVVLTSDHGEMGGDHWCFEKAGYWDESYRIPLIVADPREQADATRGLVVQDITESVDVLPTILDWIGCEIPNQVDGWPLTPWIANGTRPEHWRTEAHFEWDFRHPVTKLAEGFLGVPSAHCSLNVVRSNRYKYVQFAAESDVLPPLLFDLETDPDQLTDLSGSPEYRDAAWECAQQLLRWRMRNDERMLTNHILDPYRGLVVAEDTWR
ncbi:MAG: alkaline phosphatase family protein [Acidimicrobiales bacterium]|jgi:arylsulfatase A-like enzyme